MATQMKRRKPKPPPKPRGELTDKQRAILEAVIRFIGTQGYAPTARDLGDEFDMYPSNVFAHLGALERRGYIARRVGTARSIRVLKNPDGTPINEG